MTVKSRLYIQFFKCQPRTKYLYGILGRLIIGKNELNSIGTVRLNYLINKILN